MTRTSHPTDVVIRIKGYPLFPIFFADELHTIIANKYGRCSSYNREIFFRVAFSKKGLGEKEFKYLDEHMFA